MKKIIITLLKIALSVAIIGFLFWYVTRGEKGTSALGDMLRQHKRWDWLAVAWLLAGAGVVVTLVRWCYLVRALGIPFAMRDALRIGFLGVLFNLAPMGILGGDLLKAFLLAREHPGNRAKALASVVVDRIIGLYVLFWVATAGVFLTGLWTNPNPNVHFACQVVLWLTAVSTVGIAMAWVPGVMDGRWIHALARLPRIGRAIHSLVEAIAMYRRSGQVLLWASVMSIGVHVLFTVSLYFIAEGLQFEHRLSLGAYFGVWPVSAIASTIPLPAGPQETGIVFLYASVLSVLAGVAVKAGEQQGFILALVCRLINILVAALGLIYYLGGRREVEEVMHEAEDQSSRD